jgi:hypothetical protein
MPDVPLFYFIGRKQPWSLLPKGRGADISPDKRHSRKAVFDQIPSKYIQNRNRKLAIL